MCGRSNFCLFARMRRRPMRSWVHRSPATLQSDNCQLTAHSDSKFFNLPFLIGCNRQWISWAWFHQLTEPTRDLTGSLARVDVKKIFFLINLGLNKEKFTGAGLERMTSGLTYRRSTNWAIQPYVGDIPISQYLSSGVPVRSHSTVNCRIASQFFFVQTQINKKITQSVSLVVYY